MALETQSRRVVQIDAPVVSNIEIIENHKVLTCVAPEIAELAQPGHFINAFASGTINSILRKPFSIFKANPSSGEIAILYQVHGATTFGMARKMTGDTLDIVGPLGGKLFDADPLAPQTHVMVGGGYGVPPLVFLAERIREINPAAEIRFIVGARSRELLLCEADIAGLEITAEMTTEDGSHGRKGRVTDALSALFASGLAAQVYCCGPTSMMQAVAHLCLTADAPCQVSLEVPMPCGVGACMGCVVDIAGDRRVRACTDGPVFNSKEVIW